MAKRSLEDDITQPSTSNGPPRKHSKIENESNNELGAEKKSKFAVNSLDSDEEDDTEKTDKYEIDAYDIEGEEVSTIDRDGDIKITPFNMEEETEELGHIDSEGTFIFSKEKDAVKDNWLDNIDNVKVTDGVKPSTAHLFEEEEVGRKPNLDPLEHYRAMLELLRPGESITKALKRLGSHGAGGARERWRRKKEGLPPEDQSSAEERQKLEKLTSLANDILLSGNMDIYQFTFEKLSLLVEKPKDIPSSNDNEALDMFAEDFDEKLAAQNDSLRKQQKEDQENKTSNGGGEEVRWEFKWQKEGSQVYGPHSTEEMVYWQTQDYFKDGVWVRKTGNPQAPFYSSKRIDFELYQ